MKYHLSPSPVNVLSDLSICTCLALKHLPSNLMLVKSWSRIPELLLVYLKLEAVLVVTQCVDTCRMLKFTDFLLDIYLFIYLFFEDLNFERKFV